MYPLGINFHPSRLTRVPPLSLPRSAARAPVVTSHWREPWRILGGLGDPLGTPWGSGFPGDSWGILGGPLAAP